MKLNLTILLTITTLMGVFSLKTKAQSGKEIGIQLYSVREDMKKDIKTAIVKLGKIGYTFVEAANYEDGKFYGMEPESFKALLEANGMKFVSSHAGINCTGDQASWDTAMIWWDKAIESHKKAGCQYIIKPSMGSYPYTNLDALKKTCEYFNAIGEKCNAKGIRFGYHNHDKEFVNISDGDELVYDFILQNTDSQKVIFEMDVYWVFKGGQNIFDYFERYPNRFELLHIKDEKEIGSSGLIDYKSIYHNKAAAGTKWCIVEVERYDYEPMESVKRSYDFLNKASYVK